MPSCSRNSGPNTKEALQYPITAIVPIYAQSLYACTKEGSHHCVLRTYRYAFACLYISKCPICFYNHVHPHLVDPALRHRVLTHVHYILHKIQHTYIRIHLYDSFYTWSLTINTLTDTGSPEYWSISSLAPSCSLIGIFTILELENSESTSVPSIRVISFVTDDLIYYQPKLFLTVLNIWEEINIIVWYIGTMCRIINSDPTNDPKYKCIEKRRKKRNP